MIDMTDDLPNKDDIYIQCLSYELGLDYHALHKCENKNGLNYD